MSEQAPRWLPAVRAALLLLAAAPCVFIYATATDDTAALSLFALKLTLWNLSPALVAFALAAIQRPWLALGWLVGFAAASWWAFVIAVIAPTSSTSSLVFLFLPLYTILGCGPAGALGAVLIRRRLQARHAQGST